MALAAASSLARVGPATARATGIVTDSCDSCHGGGTDAPTVTLSPDRTTFNPGDTVTFTLSIRSPSVRVGGAFITTGGIGVLQTLAGEGLASRDAGLTHTAPKTATNGEVKFRFGWQAPAKAGGLDLRAAVLAGNGNNAPTGDAPGSVDFQAAFGCTARTFYVDLDRDGYGAKAIGTLLGCMGDQPPAGYATVDGDCDENDEKVHPGATEICNKKDDNCDGTIDENAPAVMMWPDGDGDGYYPSATGEGKLGCGNIPGYAPRGGDCNDRDATIHPGATEICNNRDDNCDGNVDERVRPQCGIGWCARYSPTCDAADCRPGPPTVETCNGFDDDCDGVPDNDACPGGQTCTSDHVCMTGTNAGTGGSNAASGGAGAAGGSGGSGGAPRGVTGGVAGSVPGGTGGDAGETARAGGCAVAASSKESLVNETAVLVGIIGLCARRRRRSR